MLEDLESCTEKRDGIEGIERIIQKTMGRLRFFSNRRLRSERLEVLIVKYLEDDCFILEVVRGVEVKTTKRLEHAATCTSLAAVLFLPYCNFHGVPTQQVDGDKSSLAFAFGPSPDIVFKDLTK